MINSLKINNILTIDDSRNIDSVDNIFKGVNINSTVTLARDVELAVKHLEEAFTNKTLPEVILFDTCCFDYSRGLERLNEEWGEENAQKIIEWYKNKNLENNLPFIMFHSADYELAVYSSKYIERKFAIKTYPFDQYEPKVSSSLLDGDLSEYNTKTTGFREFLNQALGYNLLIDETKIKAMQQNSVECKSPRYIFNQVASGEISKSEALKELKQSAKQTAKNDLCDRVIFPEGTEIKGIDFKAYTESAISGVAAFSITDVKRIKYSGKKPILLIDSYDADIVPFFKDLAGLVMLSPSKSGHLKLLLKGFNVSGLLGASNLGSEENFPFLKNPDGSDFTHALRFEKENDVTYLADYTKSVTNLAVHHRMINCPDCILDEGFNKSQVSSLVVDLDNMKADKKIFPADALTIDTNGALYKGEFQIKKGDLDKERHHWVNTVTNLLREETEEKIGHHINFKVSLDYPEQEYMKYQNDGIGLIRTEHFILSQADQQELLKQVLLDQTHKSLQKLAYGLQQDLLEGIFSFKPEINNKPKRIRLLDMPIKELSLTKEESDRFEDLYGVENTRGVQLAMKFPSIYESQLKGIFSAMRKNKDRNNLYSFANVEIMVPTVENEKEMIFVKNLATSVANRFEIPRDAYKIGSMIETMSACENIESIVSHCDFISMGTNDLTSEAHQCPRDDFNKREALSIKKGFDPFVLLTKEVSSLIKQNIKRARAVKKDLQVDVCGDHACNLENLEILTSCEKDESINGVSLPPSPKNLIDLRLNHDYNFISRKNKIEEVKSEAFKVKKLSM